MKLDRKYVVAGFFFGVLLLLLYLFLKILQPFFFVIFWATTLVVVFYPVQVRFERWFRGRKSPAAAVVTLFILVVLVIPLTLVATTLGKEIVEAFDRITGYFSEQNMDARLRQLLSFFPQKWFEFAEERLGLKTLATPEALRGLLERIARGAVEFIPVGAKGFVIGILYIFLLIFTLFFFLRDGPGMVRNLKTFIPMKPDQKDRIANRFYDILQSVIAGVLITATVQAALISTLFYIMDIPFPIMAGVVTFLGAVLPIGGASLAWIPGSIGMFLTGQTVKGVVLLAVGALVISSIDNILKPLIIGGRANLPTIFLFFSILGGIRLFGFTGILLGPVILAVFLSLLEIYRTEYQEPGEKQATTGN